MRSPKQPRRGGNTRYREDECLPRFPLSIPGRHRSPGGFFASLLSLAALAGCSAPTTAKAAAPDIYLVGDSISYGWQSGGLGQSAPVLLSLAQGLGIDSRRIRNLGANGTTTADWAGTPILDAAISQAPPSSLFLICLGTNDARLGWDARGHLFHARNLVAKIQRGGHVALWNASPWIDTSVSPGADAWPEDAASRITAYNARIAETGAIVGDLSAFDWFSAHPARLPDGVHPDRAGAEQLGRLWAAAAPGRYAPEPGVDMFIGAVLIWLWGALVGHRWGSRGKGIWR